MVLGQVLGELVPRELLSSDHPVHDAGLLEHDEVPIHGALWQAARPTRQVRGRHWVPRLAQSSDERAALRRVALTDGAKTRLDQFVDPTHRTDPSARNRGTLPRLTSATAAKDVDATRTIVPLGASPQMRDAARPSTTAATPMTTLDQSVPRNERASS